MAAKLSRPFRTAIKTWRTLCDWPMFDLVEDAASKMRSADIDSLRGRLTSATCNFSQHLATQRGACLAQIWVPDSQANGPVTLHTQVGALQDPRQRSESIEAVHAIYEVLFAQCKVTASFLSAARHLYCIISTTDVAHTAAILHRLPLLHLHT